MKKTILSVAMILAALSLYSQDKRLAGLDSFINRVLKEWHAAGVGIAVVEKNKVILAKGYGFRDIDKKYPVNDSTLFAIGSCTKAFTSSLLGILANEGKLDLDKPVYTFMPELQFVNTSLSDNITTRDMMSHRTGLPRHDMAWYGAPSRRDSLLYRIRFFENSANLREKWQYNNFMFLAQGCLAEKLSGKKWEELVSEKIFLPLGMNNSSPYISVMEKGTNAAVGYEVKKDSLITRMNYLNIDAVGPAGSINSSPKEMAKWVITWINGGKYNGKEILPSSYVNQAISSQMVINAGLPSPENQDVHFANYGLAWSLASYRGHFRVEHGGNIDGFSANTSFYPSDSIGIVVLVNQNGSPLPTIIRNTISDKMLGLSSRNWNQFSKNTVAKNKEAAKLKKSADSADRKIGTKPSHAMTDYAGVYKNPGYGNIVVTRTGDSLAMRYNRLSARLRHYHYDIFNVIPLDDITGEPENDGAQKMTFGMNVKGDIENLSIQFEAAVKPIVFTKEIEALNLKKADLEKYTGEYNLPGAAIKVYVKGENTLMMLVPGQPDYELVPVKTHEFNIKSLSGYSVKFDVDEKNIVTAANLVQPNGIFKAPKKN
ncbi:MAG TPA: serine hydrolase [Chitinophagaceae bacterium]|nr:serine hydrolase [Chitinophagaceae bacterium]